MRFSSREKAFVSLTSIVFGLQLCLWFYSPRLKYLRSPTHHYIETSFRKHEYDVNSTLHIVPNFLVLGSTARSNDTSIVTHISDDKISRFYELSKGWGGPISCSIYVENKSDIESIKNSLNELFAENSIISFHAVVSVGYSDPYPINVQRNVAMQNAHTDYVLAIDADFVPSPGSYGEINKWLLDGWDTKLKKKHVLIVPSFERHIRENEDISAISLPKSKDNLISSLQSKLIEPFHVAYFAPGHGPTNFQKWYHISNPYSVSWKPRFEPYVVVFRHNIPKYWEGFNGYGYNKLSWIMELNVANYTFWVLPNSFLIHINHPGREGRWPKSRMQNEYFKRFKPYLMEKYNLDTIDDVEWT